MCASQTLKIRSQNNGGCVVLTALVDPRLLLIKQLFCWYEKLNSIYSLYKVLYYHLFDKEIWDCFIHRENIWLITFWSTALSILILYIGRSKHICSEMAYLFWKGNRYFRFIIQYRGFSVKRCHHFISPLGQDMILTLCDKNTCLKVPNWNRTWIVVKKLHPQALSFHFHNPPQDTSVCAVLTSTTEATPCLQPKLRHLLRQYHCFKSSQFFPHQIYCGWGLWHWLPWKMRLMLTWKCSLWAWSVNVSWLNSAVFPKANSFLTATGCETLVRNDTAICPGLSQSVAQ